MPDTIPDSTARLEALVRNVMKERDPVKCDQLAAEMCRVLEEPEQSGRSCHSLSCTIPSQIQNERK